jgi:hypothetical protein
MKLAVFACWARRWKERGGKERVGLESRRSHMIVVHLTEIIQVFNLVPLPSFSFVIAHKAGPLCERNACPNLKPPHPRNSWILYRRDQLRLLPRGQMTPADVSHLISRTCLC